MKSFLEACTTGLPHKYVLYGALLVTQNKSREVFRGDIFVDQGRIRQVDKHISENVEYIDCSHYAICPGLVNTHLHLGETIFRGLAEGLNLEQYLDFTENFWMSQTTSKLVAHNIISQVTAIEALSWGTTTFCCMRGWNSILESGLNLYLGYPLMSSNKLKSYLTNWHNKYKKLARALSRYSIELGIFMHSIPTVDSNVLSQMSRFINNIDVSFFSIHVAETDFQSEQVKLSWGLSEIEVLSKYNLLTPKTILVHCNWLEDRDFEVIANSGASIAICPISSLKLRNKLPDIYKMLDYDIKIALATDGLATNNSANLLETAKFAGLVWPDLSSQTLLDLVTINAADCLQSQAVGSIELGKRADIALFSLQNSTLYPLERIVSNLVFSSTGKPDAVITNGKISLFGRHNTWIDTETALLQFENLSK